MQERLREFIIRERLIPQDKELVVAVSGGVDSVVAVHLLLKLGYRLSIAHCNFELRGDESDEDQRFVEDLANRLNLPFFTMNFNTRRYSEKEGLSIQEAARELRYQWFAELHRVRNAVIATAHHKDDLLETVMINWMRGTGVKGLAGIPIKRGHIIRPLLCLDRKEIESFAKEESIRFRIDSSNAKKDYLRNALRLEVIPKWKELDDGLLDRSAQNAELIRYHEENYRSLLQKSGMMSVTDTARKITISALLSYPRPASLLYDLIGNFGFTPTQCNDIIRDLDGDPGAVYPTKSYSLIRDREELIITEKRERSDVVINGTGEFRWGEHTISVRKIDRENIQFDRQNKRVYFQSADAPFPWLIRRWKAGDRIELLGLNGSKLVSDILIDAKVPRNEKESTPVLIARGDVLWVGGHGISESVKVKNGTDPVIQITLI